MKVFLIFTFILSFFTSCKNFPPENEDQLNKVLNEFTNYRKDSIFSSYIFEGTIPKYANEYLIKNIRIRKELGLNDISKGKTNGFEFGFQLNFNEYVSYYLYIRNQEKKITAKLFKSKFEFNGQHFNKVFGYSTLEFKRIFLDSFNIKPNLGWTNLFNKLHLLNAHKLLNESDTTLEQHHKNVIIEQANSFIFEFANKSNYRISVWLLDGYYPNFKERVLVDNIIKLLYKEFNLKKYITEMKQYPY